MGNLEQYIAIHKNESERLQRELDKNKKYLERIRGAVNELEWQQLSENDFIDFVKRQIKELYNE